MLEGYAKTLRQRTTELGIYRSQIHGNSHAVAVDEETWRKTVAEHLEVVDVRFTGGLVMGDAFNGGRQGGEHNRSVLALRFDQLVQYQMLGTAWQVVER